MVSVVIPVHNSEKYLERCLQSVVNQTLKDVEIIVVLNGCTDLSKKIALSYGKKIKIIELKTSSIGNARNEGANLARGEYILFFDSDDFMSENMCEALYDYAIQNKTDITTSDYYTYYESSKKKEYTHTYDFEATQLMNHEALLYKINYGPVKLFKKKFIIDNQLSFPTNLKYEDIPFIALSLKKASKIGKVPLPLFNYVIHNGSEQTTVDSKVVDIIKIMDMVNFYYKEDKIYEDALCSFNTYILTTYMLKQRYQVDLTVKNEFINQAFTYLNKNFPKWKICPYMRKQNLIKRFIKRNKKLIKLYCGILQFWK